MKKKIILVLLLLLVVIDVKAIETNSKIYIGEYIPNIYIIKKEDSIKHYKQPRFLRREVDDKAVYCLEPFKDLVEDTYYNGYVNKYYERLNISESKWKKISQIAYYGYGYSGHTSDKWYVITQIMIWRVLYPDNEFYFTSTLNGAKTTAYDEEIQEINNLVTKHNIVPSFTNKVYNYSINSNIVLTDINKVLNQYTLSTSTRVSKRGNDLLINTGNTPLQEVVTVTKRTDNYGYRAIVMLKDSSQKVLLPGNIDSVEAKLTINALSGKIKITKLDYDTNKKEPLGEGILIGSKYGLYNENDELLQELIINNNNEANIDNLEFGTYKIKEIESMKGYQLDNKEYQVIIDESNINIELMLKNRIIKEKIILNKYLEEGLPEKDIYFEIYDMNDELIDKIKTNEEGNAEIELVYGNYIFKQVNTSKNYLKVDNFKVIIDNNQNNNVYDLYDKKFSSKLRLILKNELTKELIKEKAIFELCSVDSNKCIEEIVIEKGELLSNNYIKAGKYYIEQTKEPKGYKKHKEKVYFVIDESNEFDANLDNDLIYNVTVYNEKIPQMTVKVPNTSQMKEPFEIELILLITLLQLFNVKIKKI